MEWILNRGFWIVHAVLIGLFALALATIATRMIGNRLDEDSLQVKPAAKRSARTQKLQRKSRSHYSAIIDKNIFHAVVVETSPPKKTVEEKPITADELENLAKTPLSVRLRGTAVRDKGGSFAVIEDKRARKEDLYRIGDMILGEAKLMQIFEDRVVLLRDGQKETLELFGGKEEPKGQPREVVSSRRSPAVLGKGIRRLGGDRWSVPREDIESAKANMSQLMTQVRIVPNFVEGNPDGFKLLSIKRGSIFDRLGLRNGDVVRSINGVLLDNPQKAFELYEGLESGQSISVDILRGKRDLTFTYVLK